MVKITKKREPKVREIKSNVTILSSKKDRPETLESEVEALETMREASFIRRGSQAPSLRQTTAVQATPDTPIQPRMREVEDRSPATYTARTDAEVYTALSTENATARYMPASRGGGRSAMGSRAQGSSSPSLGSSGASQGSSHDRVIGQPSGLQGNAPRLSNPSNEGLGRQYGLYNENSLQDANRARTRRR